MVKQGLGLLLLCLINKVLFAAQVLVFVSFSMPTKLMEEILAESSHFNIPVYLNGLYHDSMPETARKVMALSEQIPNLTLQIDPTLFDRFGIKQVPALVVANGNAFDVIYGHLSIKEGLARMAGHGDVDFSLADLRRN